MTQQRLPVMKLFDEMVRSQRREGRRSLEGSLSSSALPREESGATGTTSRLPKIRRRTFDDMPSSPSRSSLPPTLPVLKVIQSNWCEADLRPVTVRAPTAQVIRLGKLLALLVRSVGAFLIVLRRARAVLRIRKFLQLKDKTRSRRLLSQKINRVMNMIARIQRAWRSAVVCKRARMKVVMQMWDDEEAHVVRAMAQGGEHLRRTVWSRESSRSIRANEPWGLSTERDDKRSDRRDDGSGVNLIKRWKAIEGRFKEFDKIQTTSAKALVLPKRLKVQFARKYVETARKDHLKRAKNAIAEEVERLRLRVHYTTEDAKQLLELGEEGPAVILDRLRMQFLLENMTESNAMTTYKNLLEEQAKGGSHTDVVVWKGPGGEGGEGETHPPTMVRFQIPKATFAFYQHLCTPAQKELIRTEVRKSHTTMEIV